MSKRIYILDAGHGGINPSTGQYVTPGKRSVKWPDGSILYEGVNNRKIAQLVGNKIKALGISVVYTVEPSEWRDIALSTRVARAEKAKQLANKDAILISIHSNASDNAQANGMETFTSPGQTPSDPFATILINELKTAFPELKSREDVGDGDPDKEAKFTILMGNYKAMLVELGFHSNEKECKLLASPAGHERYANAIVSAIKKMELL